jgi:hypothetical protein
MQNYFTEIFVFYKNLRQKSYGVDVTCPIRSNALHMTHANNSYHNHRLKFGWNLGDGIGN